MINLVKKGVEHIKKSGHRIETHSGGALQSNNVTYVLTDCRNRVHTLRSEKAITYFARELLAYFCGSLNINGKYVYGLVNASKFRAKISDENNCINSNYGYYVFHQLTQENKTQIQWIREKLLMEEKKLDYKIQLAKQLLLEYEQNKNEKGER